MGRMSGGRVVKSSNTEIKGCERGREDYSWTHSEIEMRGLGESSEGFTSHLLK